MYHVKQYDGTELLKFNTILTKNGYMCAKWPKQQKIVHMQTKVNCYINKDERGLWNDLKFI